MDGNEFGGHAVDLCDNISTVDDKAFNYLISDINCPSSDLNVFENTENKISSDLLYYDWPEIGNFEDVDRMFRSCDSIFGLGVSKEELSWLSSADDLSLGGDGDVLNSNYKFPCPEPNVAEHMSENHASNRGCSMNDSMGSAPIRSRDSSWTSDKTDYYRSFVTGPAVVDQKNGFNLNTLDQINEQEKNIKPQNQPKEGKGYNFQNGSLKCSEGLPSAVMQLSGLSYNQAFPYSDMQHLPQFPKLHSPIQNSISNVHSDNSLLSDLASVDLKPPPAKSDTNSLFPLLPSDAFGTPGQLHTVQSSNENPPLEISGQWKNLHSRQGSRSSVNSSVEDGDATMFDPVIGGASATPEEIGSLGMPISLMMSSNKADMSLEAACFRQLQLVMKQLDLQTKLCIRDGLYRLARSASKRRNRSNPSIRCGSTPEQTKSFTDMETGTNPIDRSIAHLLFHQGSDSSSTASPHDSLPTMVCIE